MSNFYLNLSKYLNKDFHAFDTLIAENFYQVNDLEKAKKYEQLMNIGIAFKWYSAKQIARILVQRKKKRSIKILKFL